ncbi:DUF6090 family protein [Winogradskyella sp. A3E31]|uniref:DUF6090 family protein n=1 Tax=Winogradskyella sp. A3E31 TaxID=3349637 RepID=UPI00398B993B
MIKFFRQIRYNLMETGKTGKYLKYAIGEIILVVIGILIALQINNWNENQKKSAYQKNQLSNLRTEIMAMSDFLKTQIGYFEKAKLGTKSYLSIAESETPLTITPDSVGTLFNYALNTDLVTSERLRFETKIDFKSLPKQSYHNLEQKLIDWRHFAEKIGADFQHIENNRENNLQRAMLNAGVPGWHTLYNSYEPPNFPIDYDALLKNREVYAEMYYRHGRMSGIVREINLGIDDLNTMLVEIDKVLNPSKTN